MLNTPETLPSDPAELRRTAEGLVQLVKSQALKIGKRCGVALVVI